MAAVAPPPPATRPVVIPTAKASEALVIFVDLDSSLHEGDLKLPESSTVHTTRLNVLRNALKCFLTIHSLAAGGGLKGSAALRSSKVAGHNYAFFGVLEDPCELMPLSPIVDPSSATNTCMTALDQYLPHRTNFSANVAEKPISLGTVVQCLDSVQKQQIGRLVANGMRVDEASKSVTTRGILIGSRSVEGSSPSPLIRDPSANGRGSMSSAAVADVSNASRKPGLYLDVVWLGVDGPQHWLPQQVSADLHDLSERKKLTSFSVSTCPTGLSVGNTLNSLLNGMHHSPMYTHGLLTGRKMKGVATPEPPILRALGRPSEHQRVVPGMKVLKLTAAAPPPPVPAQGSPQTSPRQNAQSPTPAPAAGGHQLPAGYPSGSPVAAQPQDNRPPPQAEVVQAVPISVPTGKVVEPAQPAQVYRPPSPAPAPKPSMDDIFGGSSNPSSSQNLASPAISGSSNNVSAQPPSDSQLAAALLQSRAEEVISNSSQTSPAASGGEGQKSVERTFDGATEHPPAEENQGAPPLARDGTAVPIAEEPTSSGSAPTREEEVTPLGKKEGAQEENHQEEKKEVGDFSAARLKAQLADMALSPTSSMKQEDSSEVRPTAAAAAGGAIGLSSPLAEPSSSSGLAVDRKAEEEEEGAGKEEAIAVPSGSTLIIEGENEEDTNSKPTAGPSQDEGEEPPLSSPLIGSKPDGGVVEGAATSDEPTAASSSNIHSDPTTGSMFGKEPEAAADDGGDLYDDDAMYGSK